MNAINYIIKSEFCDRRKHSKSELFYGTENAARVRAQNRFDALHSKGCSNIIVRIFAVRETEYCGAVRG